MKDVKVLVVAFVVFVLIVLLMFNISSKHHTKRAYKLYEQGLYYANKGDYQNAYYNFSKISRLSKIYHIALLKQGFCALSLSDKKIAYDKFNYLSFLSRDKYIAPVALYNAALIDLEQNRNFAAYKKFKKLYDKYSDSDYKKASAYHLGVIFKNKNPSLAKKYFMEYIEYAPNGRYVFSAIDEVLSLNVYLFENDKYLISYALYKNDKFDNALEQIKGLDDIKCTFLRAKIYDTIHGSKNALLGYTKVLTSCDLILDDKDIAFAVSRYIELSGVPKSQACKHLLKITKNLQSYPFVLYEYASTLSKMNAIKCYETIYTKYPDSYQAAQSLWYVFYDAYLNNYNSKVKALAKIYFEKYSNKISTPAVKFWYAKTLLKERKIKAAKQEFRELIKTEPNSYYAYVAYNILNDVYTPFNTPCCDEVTEAQKFSYEDLRQIFNNEQTLLILAAFNDIDVLKAMRVHNDFILSYIAYKDGNVPYSVYLASNALKELSQKPQYQDARYKLAYPKVFVGLINKHCADYAQNAYLILALTREESSFNKNAISPVGAAGLMQLMPNTASSLGFGELSANDLFNPDLNINLGVKYFSSLRDMFDGCEMLAVLSYNGGPSNVMNWKNNVIQNGDFDEFVEGIPYIETQNYIKRVFESYWNYSRIYAKQ